MALVIKRVDCLNIIIDSSVEAAYDLFSGFADVGIGLLTFRAVPVENKKNTVFTFPE